MIPCGSATETTFLSRRHTSKIVGHNSTFSCVNQTLKMITVLTHGNDSCLQLCFPASSLALMSLCKILLERSHSSISMIFLIFSTDLSLGMFLPLIFEMILIFNSICQKTFRFVCLNPYELNVYIGKHCSILCVLQPLLSCLSVSQSSLLVFKVPTWTAFSS